MSIGASGHYTFADLWDFPDDGQRRELIDGVLYVTPMARIRHQLVVMYLSYVLYDWVREHGGQVFPGCNVDFDERTHFEPDVAFLRPGREVGDVLSLHEPPDIVIEVSSPSTKRYDLGVKRDRFEQRGTGEFWFVDLDREVLLVSVLRDGAYGPVEIYRRGDVLRTQAAPGLAIDVAEVFTS